MLPGGTSKKVCNELLNISYGFILTYKDLDFKTGNIKAYGTVSKANGANCIAILIPCRRVINSINGLGGYSVVSRKKLLLNHEKNVNV